MSDLEFLILICIMGGQLALTVLVFYGQGSLVDFLLASKARAPQAALASDVTRVEPVDVGAQQLHRIREDLRGLAEASGSLEGAVEREFVSLREEIAKIASAAASREAEGPLSPRPTISAVIPPPRPPPRRTPTVQLVSLPLTGLTSEQVRRPEPAPPECTRCGHARSHVPGCAVPGCECAELLVDEQAQTRPISRADLILHRPSAAAAPR